MDQTHSLREWGPRKSAIRGAIRSRRADPIRLIGLVGLLVVTIVWLWQLPHFLAGNSTVWPQYATAFYDMLFYTVWGFAVLLLLTAFTRTVSLKTLLAFWFLGVFAVHGVVIAIGIPFRDTIGVDGVGIWVAPVTETLIVAFVVLLFYIVATYHRSAHPTVSDGLLVGFATGAGLGFHEEMTYGRLVPIGPGAEYASVGNTGQDIWWSYVFPLIGWQSFFNIRQFGNGVAGHFTLYHAGWGTLLGIGIGFAYVHRHCILAWLVAVLAIAVTYFEHMSGNWGVMGQREPAPVVGDLFQTGDVHGVTELAVYILLAAIAGAILTDVFVLRRTASRLDGFPSVRAKLLSGEDRSGISSGIINVDLGSVRRLRALDEYARYRRAFLIGLYRLQKTNGDPAAHQTAVVSLYTTGRKARIVGGVGICSTTAMVVLGSLSSGGLTVFTGLSNGLAMSCAACTALDRLMDTFPSAIGSVPAVVAAYCGLNATEKKSRELQVEDYSREELKEMLKGAKYAIHQTRIKTSADGSVVFDEKGRIVHEDGWGLPVDGGVLFVDHIAINYLRGGDSQIVARVGDELVPLNPEVAVKVWDSEYRFDTIYPPAPPDPEAERKSQAEVRRLYDQTTMSFDPLDLTGDELDKVAEYDRHGRGRGTVHAGGEAMNASRSVLEEGAKAAITRTGDPTKIGEWFNNLNEIKKKHTEGRREKEKKRRREMTLSPQSEGVYF